MTQSEHWPTHAYVPGQNERHPEGAFDLIRDTVRPGMTVEELANSAAFQHGLRYLEAGYFWEAHEVLEPVWMALSNDSAERSFVQGLIQLANGRLKLRMNRPKASHRLAAMARDLIDAVSTPQVMGLKTADARRQIDSLESEATGAL